jgi:hypothetical protein
VKTGTDGKARTYHNIVSLHREPTASREVTPEGEEVPPPSGEAQQDNLPF